MGLSNAGSEKHAKLHIYYGVEFGWAPNLVYVEGEEFDLCVHPNYLSVDDVNDTVIKLGYGEHRTHKTYIMKPNVEFEQSLHPLETNKDVHLLINLCLTKPVVYLYVKHMNSENWVHMPSIAGS